MVEIVSEWISNNLELKLEIKNKKYSISLFDIENEKDEIIDSGKVGYLTNFVKVKKRYISYRDELLDVIYGNSEVVYIRKVDIDRDRKLCLKLHRNKYSIILLEEVYYSGHLGKNNSVEIESYYINKKIEYVMERFNSVFKNMVEEV